jgi:hypothetical protein
MGRIAGIIATSGEENREKGEYCEIFFSEAHNNKYISI